MKCGDRGSLKKLAFTKKARLLSNSSFKAVLARKIWVSDGLLVLFMAENDLLMARVGISIGKAFGNAVRRNRLKRLIREAFRQHQLEIPRGFDYLLMISPRLSMKLNKSKVASEKLKSITFEQIQESLVALVRRGHGKIA